MSYQNLFVSKIPRALKDEDFLAIFADYHPTSAKVMLDAKTGKSKCFGFVLFSDVQEGERAFNEMNFKEVSAQGTRFTLTIFPSNHDGVTANEESKALYIRNIPKRLEREAVEEFLEKYGTLVYCALRHDHHTTDRWVVYAEYEDLEAARNALNDLHNSTNHFGGNIPVLAKYADSEKAKSERRSRKEHQQRQREQVRHQAQRDGHRHQGFPAQHPAAMSMMAPGPWVPPMFASQPFYPTGMVNSALPSVPYPPFFYGMPAATPPPAYSMDFYPNYAPHGQAGTGQGSGRGFGGNHRGRGH